MRASQRAGAGIWIRRALAATGVLVAMLALPATVGAVIPGPNGKIVFTSGRDDGFQTFDSNHAQLWVANKVGATPTRVTANAAIQHRHAAWSPDRTKLVYSAGDASTSNFDIWILDVTLPTSSTNPRDITNSPGFSEDRPSWSPDGTRIAYSDKLLPSGTRFIVVQNANGPELMNITQPASTGDADRPVWSPDSQTLYYSLVVNPGMSPVDDDIYKKAADNSGTATPVVTGTGDDYQPALSPDGQSMCFTEGAFGTTSATVQRTTITGANKAPIANSGLGDYNCVWSPDGTKIAYVQGIFTNGDLKMKNSDGSGTPTDLVPNVAGRFDGNPDWATNPSPTCLDSSVTTGFNAFVSIPLNCTDPAPENDPVTRSLVGSPTHGSLGAINQNAVLYTPIMDFSGADQFTFRGNDGTSDSNVATVHLTVLPDRTPATISKVAVDPNRWRLGPALPQISRKRAPVGTKIKFNLSETARVTLTFAKAQPGRKVRRRCVKPTRSNRKRRRCTRYVTAGRLSFNAHVGANRVKFQGRLSRTRKLTVGSYLLTIGATDRAGNRSTPRTASFTIVQR